MWNEQIDFITAMIINIFFIYFFSSVTMIGFNEPSWILISFQFNPSVSPWSGCPPHTDSIQKTSEGELRCTENIISMYKIEF